MILILPGYSPHNLDWAKEAAEYLKEKLDNKVLIHKWKHWKSGSFSLSGELKSIEGEIGKDDFMILAKSVGTLVCSKLIERKLPKKIILCGIPSVSDKRKEIMKKAFVDYSEKNLLCIQNTKDPFANYKDVLRMMKSINKNFTVIEMKRSDHNYPYYEDFLRFFRS